MFDNVAFSIKTSCNEAVFYISSTPFKEAATCFIIRFVLTAIHKWVGYGGGSDCRGEKKTKPFFESDLILILCKVSYSDKDEIYFLLLYCNIGSNNFLFFLFLSITNCSCMNLISRFIKLEHIKSRIPTEW